MGDLPFGQLKLARKPCCPNHKVIYSHLFLDNCKYDSLGL
jgi:hypothetical protein